jgi:hypothetical protein
MNDRRQNPRKLNIGIYGATKAGKTTFLFQLLDHWKGTDRVLNMSEQALEFLRKVRAANQNYGAAASTSGAVEGITVLLEGNAGKEPWELTFRDSRGEELTKELSPEGSVQENGLVDRQVRECNAFLFFFDPTSSDQPTDLEGHYEREFRRASAFIKYVLKKRENRLLPVLFVQTRADQLGDNSPTKIRADSWTEEVHKELSEAFRADLKGLYPKSMTEKSRTFLRVCSVGTTQQVDESPQRIIEGLQSLELDCQRFRSREESMGRYYLVVGLLVAFVLFPLCVLFVYWSGGSQSESQPKGPAKISEMTQSEIDESLDQLERLLEANLSTASLPSVDDAASINGHLRWLSQRLQSSAGSAPGLQAETRQRAESVLATATKLLEETAAAKVPFSEQLPVLTAFLSGLPDLTAVSKGLGEVQQRYWRLQRSFVIEEFAEVIGRRKAVASSAIDAFEELIGRIRDFEEELNKCDVLIGEAKSSLITEIQTAGTFCEDRKKSGVYAIKFRIASAEKRDAPHADFNWRNLRLVSPGHSDWLSKDGVALIPKDEVLSVDIEPAVLWGAECRDNYKNQVNLQLNGEKLWSLEKTSKKNSPPDLLPLRQVRVKRSDQLKFECDIEVTDGTFVISSRKHGNGSLKVEAGELLDGEKEINLGEYARGNLIKIVARLSEGEPKSKFFETKKTDYEAVLGLGSSVTGVLSELRSEKWITVNESEFATDPGPLAGLGMPLLRRGVSTTLKRIEAGGMEIRLEISESETVPSLLWDAANSAKGDQNDGK